MRQRTVINLTLLVLLAALLVIVMREPGIEKPAAATLFSIAPDSVQTLRITSTRQGPVTLARHNREWQLTEPYNIAANPVRVNAILAILHATPTASYPVAEFPLLNAELDVPSVSLRIDGQTIAFGGLHPLNHQRYVRLDDQVHLIEDNYYYQLDAPANSFVSLQPVPADTKLTAIAMPDLTLALTDGAWRATDKAISADQAQATGEAWKDFHALSVSHYNDERNSDQAVRLQLANGTTLAFTLAPYESDWLLVRDDLPLAWLIPARQRQDLLPLMATADSTHD